MPRRLRRWLAAVVSAALIVVSPGIETYHALGATFAPKTAPRRGTLGPSGPVNLRIPGLTTAGGALRLSPAGVLGIPPAAPGQTATLQQMVEGPGAPGRGLGAALPEGVPARPMRTLETMGRTVSEAVEELSSPGLTAETAHRVGRKLEASASEGRVDELSVEAPEAAAPGAALSKPSRDGGSGRAGGGALGVRVAAEEEVSDKLNWLDRAVGGFRRSITSPLKVVRNAVAAAALGLLIACALPAGTVQAQTPPFAAPGAAFGVQGVQGPVQGPVQEAPLPRSPVGVSITIERQGVTVGERVKFTFTLTNASDKPATVFSLRSSLEDALPEDLEIQGAAGDETMFLAAGETKTVVFEVIPFNSGDIKISGPLVMVLQGPDGPYEAETVLPDTVFQVKSVLTPDWKEKGFRPPANVMREQLPNWGWLAALPLLLALLIGAERILAARRKNPDLPPGKLSLLARTSERIARLEKGALPGPAFYAELSETLSNFLVDFLGLPVKERDAKTLARDLKLAGSLGSGQLEVATDLAARSEAARFGGAADGSDERRRALNALKALVESVAKTGPAKTWRTGAGMMGAAGLLPAAATLQFGNPWVLLLLIPLAGYVVWSWVSRRSSAARTAYTVPAGSSLPARKSLRQRLSWGPKFLQVSAVTLVLTALAGPQVGVTRQETFVPSTDTMMSIDLSGSMDMPFNGYGSGSQTKLQAAGEAVRAYVEEQRRGTTNRVGMVTFSDNTYVDVRLTTDYDALIARVKELKTTGSTAVGKSMLAAMGHFLELNALELNDPKDPRIAELQRILKDQGLGAALEYAKPHPDLLGKVVRPEHKKIVVLFTDGESNTGTPPIEAAQIAKKLGIKIYSVGIAPKGSGYVSGFDEKTLKAVADITGAQFFRAGDAERMKEVLLEISRLEKSPAKIRSSLEVKDYGQPLILLALMSLVLGIALSNTKLRTLNGFLIIMLPLAGAPEAPQAAEPAPYVQVLGQVQVQDRGEVLPLKGVPPEMASGNLLYKEGRYAEALKKYAEALEKYPELSELYFNMGNAYLKMGDAERAAAAFQKFLSLNKDPVLASKAAYNLSHLALMKKDAEEALGMLKEALRKDPSNADAKWNLEVIKKLQQESDQSQDGKKGKNKKGKGKQKGKQGNQQGKPGDQQGQPGDQEGQPGDAQSQGDPKDKEKSGTDLLSEKLGEQEKGDQESAKKGITRKGKGMWGGLALPLGLGAGSAAMTVASPLLLWGLAFLIPILVFFIAYGIKKRLNAAKALSPAAAPRDFKSWAGKPRFLAKAALILGTVGLLGVAASDPRSGLKDERLNFGGKDIVVAVDGSHSMVYAEDGREERTKKELSEFIARLQGTDRVGLVVFAGAARTASPLSIDYGNFEWKAGRLEVESRGLPEGSNLPEAIAYSARHFENAKKIEGRKRVLIVISDGDIFGQEVEEAVKAAQAHGVVVYTIGVGSPEGAKMKVPTADGTGTEYLVDENTGQPAVTRLKEEPLRQIATRTGGAYFRAGSEATIDQVLKRVAGLEKGDTGETIKSPRGIATWFLWPALLLLLLELLVPGKPVLRKDKARKGTPLAGGALMGLSFLPLHDWALIFPFAAILAVMAGLLYAEVSTGGAVTRRVRWAWERRKRVVERGLLASIGALFDPRESDLEPLSRFSRHWTQAPEAYKKKMISDALDDPQLWREKLVWAFLYGNPPETQEALLSALSAAARAYLQSPQPVILKVLSRREALPWLDHQDAARRLSRLAQAWLDPAESASRLELQRLAAYPDAEASSAAHAALGRAEPRAQAPRRGWRQRVALGLAGLLLAGTVAGAGVSGAKTVEYLREQGRAAEETLRIFFAEDMFIFTDGYVDDRIPSEVLPALKRWNRNPRASADDIERAIRVLAESPDPKADNVLEAVFKHADLLPLTPEAEKKLLTTLMMRDDLHVWKFMEEHMNRTAGNPGAAELMSKMIAIAAKEGSEKSLGKVFRFLKSPDPHLRARAASAIWASLTAKGREAQFFQRLAAFQNGFAEDPVLGLWIERILLRRLATAPAEAINVAQARGIIAKLLEIAAAVDSERSQVFAQLKPEDQDKVPSYLLVVLELMGGEEERAAEGKGKPGIPPVLADAVKFAVNYETTKLIQEAEKHIPGLHERLITAGVVLPDTEAPSYEDDYHGGGGGNPTPTYREAYKLSHLKELRRILEVEKKYRQDTGSVLTPQFAEYFDRAVKALEKMESLGEASGMLAGGSAGEKAAEDANKLLTAAYDKFRFSVQFLEALRVEGLAPAMGQSAADRFLETYSRGDLEKLAAFLRRVAASGNGWDYQGNRPPLNFGEKSILAETINGLEVLLAKHFPKEGEKPRGLWAALETPGEENLIIVRLQLISMRSQKDAVEQTRVLKRLAAHLSGPGSKEDPLDAWAVLVKVFEAGKERGMTRPLLAELEKLLAGANADGPLAKGAAKTLQGIFKDLLSEATRDFDGLKKRLVELKVKPTEWSDRDSYKLVHMKRLGRAVAAEAAKGAGPDGPQLTPAQRRTAARVEALLPRLIAIGSKTGILPGDTREELSAEAVNPVLSDGDKSVFTGHNFLDALRAAGLAPKDVSYYGEEAFHQRYTTQDLSKIREFLKDLLASGQGWENSGTRRPLTPEERALLEKAIKVLDGQLAVAPSAKKGGTKLHGFAPLGLLLGDPSLGAWIALAAAVVVVAGLAYLAFKRLWKPAAPAAAEAPARQAPSSEVFSRYRRIELASKRLANTVTYWSFRSLFIGAGGTDFSEARPYQDEDVRDIDWKTSGRLGELYAKTYELEKDMPLVLLVDLSLSSAFGTRGTDKRAVIEDAAAVLALAAGRLGLRVGAVIFTDKVEAYIPPKTGMAQARGIVRRVMELDPRGRGTDLRPALDLTLKEVHSRAMVAVVSDFLAPDFRATLRSAARRHDLRLIRVQDPSEAKPLPDAGLVTVQDPETGEVRQIDTSDAAFRRDLAAAVAAREARLSEAFSEARGRPLTLSTDGDYLEALQEHFQTKRKTR